ncbi:putative LRR containing protein [Trachipleistophora hominis]|uniref:Putative LRR containing protein n=1 Tax=Trachipleistophora hominis TaxID=72359 RepID=L7JRX5_TRAHO|nr:putative LRR containing protein [Trachipleistophora hominis]
MITRGFNCTLSIPNIVSLKKLELSDFDNLSISPKMFTLTKDVIGYVTSMNEDNNADLFASDRNIYLPIIISDYCENISISRNKIAVNIAGVLRNVSKDEVLMRIPPENKSEIVICSPKHPSKLKLHGERICGTITIEKDVYFLSLSRISSDEGSELC